MDRSELIAAFQDTMSRSMSPILKKETEQAAKSSRVYLEGFRSKKHTKRHKAEIIVEENTSFAAARKHLVHGKTAVLNFANPETPGGGVQNGAMAQEECLCRSSNLYACLTANSFPDYYQYHRELHNHFYSDRLIYTEGVTVFKDDSDVPSILDAKDWFQVDVITCAAPYIAKRKYTNRTALKELFKGRIKNVFEVAIEHNIDVLILGAFGCGAFKNPPDVVAKAFKEVIEENNYKEHFTKIVFAIKSTVNSDPFEPCPNIMAFETEFNVLSAEANKLRFSDNGALAQAICSVKMPSGKVLKGGVQIDPYREWQAKNIYFGKQFSILGDSISTLEGYNPRGYNLFYSGDTCERTGVSDMKDTWWGKVIDYVGGELLVNNSWSGSRVTKLPNRETLFPSGCSDERTGSLHIGSVMPDVIIVYLGTNDWAYGSQVEEERKGFYDDKTGMFVDGYIRGDETVFSVAYAKMLANLKRNYPGADIFCCTLNETFMSAKPSFRFPYSHGGTHIEKYNEVIRSTARRTRCKLIDLFDNHIPYDAIDGSHPTAEGMGTLASLILHGLCDRVGVSFLECDNSEHEFVTAEEYTGGTKYACCKCGLVDHDSMLQPEFFDQLYAGSTVNGRKIQKKNAGNSWDNSHGFMVAQCTNGHFFDGNRHLSCPYCGSGVKEEQKTIDVANFTKHKVIKEFHMFDGDPAVNYEYNDGKLYTYNRINPRDGGLQFPEGFFDTVEISLNDDQRQKLLAELSSLNLSNWETDKTVYDKFGCPGFCVNRKFSCTFVDGDAYVCYPSEPIPSEFNRLFALLKSFGAPKTYINIESHENTAEKKAVNTDVIDLDPNCTVLLYSADDGIRLFSESRGEDIKIYKTEFLAGRSKDSELHMSSSVVARAQATIMFDGNRWLIRDNHSTNGTWLNDTKLIPGKKYVLHPDDVIDFAHSEKFVFFKTNLQQQNSGNQAEKAVAFLEAGIKVFHDSDHKDETAFKLIVSALVNAPLYLPVSIDLEAMFGKTDPTKLKPGDVIQTKKDVSTKILTISIQDTEYVPMFTSMEQANKGPSVSTMRMSPQMYLPKVIGMDKDIVINPFSGTAFIVNRQMMKELLLPLVLPSSLKVEANDKDDLLGQRIEGKYELIQMLGRGGIVRTYLGKDLLGKTWAVKVCDKTLPNFSEHQRNAIMQEVHMMMKFNHPAIPKVENLIENEKQIIIVREYIEGSTLQELLTKNGPFTESDVIYFAKLLAAVLLYLHKFNPPYIFRDMKPMNVLVTNSRAVKLIDFGIAMEYRPGGSNDIAYLGTKGYAAPEQYCGTIDPRSDIYGLGITMHQLLTGIAPNEPPYETPPVRPVKPEISKGMEYIVQKCIALNPDERYQNCEELLLDLNNIQNLPPKKGLFSNLFAKKDKKPFVSSPPSIHKSNSKL